jgi:hypothetical protein
MNTQDDLQPRYPMNRRTFVGMVAAGAVAAVQPAPKARNVVLVRTGCSRTAHPGPR